MKRQGSTAIVPTTRHWLLVILSLVGLTFSSMCVRASPVLSISPQYASVGQHITVPIHINSIVDLFAFQFDISFNSSTLQLLAISEGPFLQAAGSTFFIPGAIDNSGGLASFTADTLLGAVPGATGSGDLALFDFKIIASGVSTIDFSNAVLLDSNLTDMLVATNPGQIATNSIPEPSSLFLACAALAICSSFIRHRPPSQPS